MVYTRYFTADTEKLQEIFECGHGIVGGVSISRGCTAYSVVQVVHGHIMVLFIEQTRALSWVSYFSSLFTAFWNPVSALT